MLYRLIRFRDSFQWFGVHPGYKREFPDLCKGIPLDHIYLAQFKTEAEAIEYGRDKGWCH